MDIAYIRSLTGRRMVVVRNRRMEIWNRPEMEEAPCPTFPKYRGVRSPMCPCRPCLDKYLDVQRSKGRRVEEIDFDFVNTEITRQWAAK